MDEAVVLNKLESLRKCISRIEDKTPATVEYLIGNLDIQDIITLNLERAIQVCVDIGLHIISGQDIPVPDTMAQTFAALYDAGYLDETVAERMAKAVGFRNTAVHAYQEIDWKIVYCIITEHLNDFRNFAEQIINVNLGESK